jgi:hypothetical protein
MVLRERMPKDRKKVSRREFVAAAAITATAGFCAALPKLNANSPLTESREKCDVLVCGATPGGIAAAVTAAKMGDHVTLVEYEDHVGGILSNGLTNTDLDKAHRRAVGGFFNDFTSRVVEYYRALDASAPGESHLKMCREGWLYEPKIAETIFKQFLAEQTRVRVMFRQRLNAVTMKGKRVAGALFESRDEANHLVRIDAKVVIDATYEGDVAALAKAEFRLGREGRDELGEPHAGRIYMNLGTTEILPGSTGEGDAAIQSYCFRFTATTDPLNRVPVEKPEHFNRSDYNYLLRDIQAGRIEKLNQVFGVYPLPGGKVEFNNREVSPETGVPSESLDLAEECWPWPEGSPEARRKIYERYLTHNVGMLWMLQNDPEIPDVLRQDARRYGWCRDEYPQNNHLPRQLYVREGRRVEGEYLLNEHDGNFAEGLERTKVQPTSIGLVEWAFDSHACHRFSPEHPGTREGYTWVDHAVFQIPYGVVVPKAVDGLLVPVACSASHVAYNALRMEPVFMALGEACGQAAHLAVTERIPARAVRVERLQKTLLANGAAITYLEDLSSDDKSFVACQWLGARGFNRGCLAEAGRNLTRGEGVERLHRALQIMKVHWSGNVDGDPAAPLLEPDVMAWLISAGFDVKSGAAPQPSPSLTGGLTIGQFAELVYGVVAV